MKTKRQSTKKKRKHKVKALATECLSKWRPNSWFDHTYRLHWRLCRLPLISVHFLCTHFRHFNIILLILY